MAVHRSARPSARTLRQVALPATLLLGVALAGCGAPPPSPSTSASSWARGSVDQPQSVTAQPSATPAYCAPCHPAVITQMRDVAATDGGFVAVGSQTPNTAMIWTSPDGSAWSITDSLPDPAGQQLDAVAVQGATVVITGRGPRGVAAWVSTAPGRWRAATVPTADGAMTAVLATDAGFIAGGYLGPEFGVAEAAFWRSSDGTSWTPIRDDPGSADGRVAALAATDSGLVAVGISGSPGSEAVGAVSWTSPDGLSWKRSRAQPALDGATMRSVAVTPAAIVAVGTTSAGDAAAAWTSSDGLAWRRAPDAPTFASNSTYAPHAEMSDVLATSDGLLAVGWNSSAANGTAVIWTSTDGVAWSRAPNEPSLSGGGMSGVTLRGSVAVAVGSTGWPDTHAATAWRRDLR